MPINHQSDNHAIGDRRTNTAERGTPAWDAALRLLGVRARSRTEMRDRLAGKNYTPDVIVETMARLDEYDLLNDADFARQWVQSRHAHSARGRRALREELRVKGIAQQLIDDALDGIDDADESDRARRLLAGKARSLRSHDIVERTERDRQKRRLVSMLMRRGYSSGLAYELVSDELERIAAKGN